MLRVVQPHRARPSRSPDKGVSSSRKEHCFAHARVGMEITGAGESNGKLDLLLDSKVLVSVGFRHSWFRNLPRPSWVLDERYLI